MVEVYKTPYAWTIQPPLPQKAKQVYWSEAAAKIARTQHVNAARTYYSRYYRHLYKGTPVNPEDFEIVPLFLAVEEDPK